MPDNNQFDPMEFRKTLGTFTTGVCVITTRAPDGEPVGLTANSFNSVSLDPPMVLWSLAKTSRNLEAFENAEHWAVHILAQGQEDLSTKFAKSGEDKFAGVETREGVGGIPLLSGCTSLMQCQSEYKYEGGDHIIFVGRVVDFQRDERPPLVFMAGRYATASDRTENTPTPEEIAQATNPSFSDNSLDYLLPRAHYNIYSRVRKFHESHGLSDHQYFVLCSLMAEDGRSWGEMNQMFGMTGHTITREHLQELKSRDLITAVPDDDTSPMHLTADGRDMALRVISESKAIEADILSNFDERDAALLKKLLRQLVRITDIGVPGLWK